MNTRRRLLRFFPGSIGSIAIGMSSETTAATGLLLVCNGTVSVAASSNLPVTALSELGDFGVKLTRMVASRSREFASKSWRFNFELVSFWRSEPVAEFAVPIADEFQIQVRGNFVSIKARTDVGLTNAAWTIAKQLGYRQYFPGVSWEYIPRLADLELTKLSDTGPDYLVRNIWHGYGTHPLNQNGFDDWISKNRAASSFVLETRHAFDRVISEFSDEFDSDLELWAELGGVRVKDRQRKPCLGNPKVQAIFAEYAFRHFRSKPSSNCVSFEPSDGGGWCRCSKWCRSIGGPSNQLVAVANHASQRLARAGFRKFVAFYAYNEHSAPPTLPVESRIIVSVATKFNKSKFSVEELIQGWARMGAIVGIRDYLSVFKWDQDLPQSAPVADIDSTLQAIQIYRLAGARIYSAEAGDNWGPYGLGYWLVMQNLWGGEPGFDTKGLIAEFCDQMFGQASHIMKGVYFRLLRPGAPANQEQLIGQIVAALRLAWSSEPAPAERRRVAYLSFYIHYCRLYLGYKASAGRLKLKLAEDLVIHVWFMRFTSMVHTKAIFSEIRRAVPELFPLRMAALKTEEQRSFRYRVDDGPHFLVNSDWSQKLPNRAKGQ